MKHLKEPWLTARHPAETALINNMVTNRQPQKGTLPTAALDHPEKLHQSFMKWSLGVGKRTSNAAIDGIEASVLTSHTSTDYG